MALALLFFLPSFSLSIRVFSVKSVFPRLAFKRGKELLGLSMVMIAGGPPGLGKEKKEAD